MMFFVLVDRKIKKTNQIYNNQRQETKWVFGQSPKTKATPTDGDSEDDMPVKKAR